MSVFDKLHPKPDVAINVTTPDRRCGKWAIQSFRVTEEGAYAHNLKVVLSHKPLYHLIKAGAYKRLVHEDRGTIMSNTPMEVHTNLPFLNSAKGNVLINGLGLGMVLHVLVDSPAVTKITVVEQELDVISLTAPHFRNAMLSGKLEIVHDNAFTFEPPPGAHYDVVWHDIWDAISDGNVSEMRTLRSKYKDIATDQFCWCERECIAMYSTIDVLLQSVGSSYEEVQAKIKNGELANES